MGQSITDATLLALTTNVGLTVLCDLHKLWALGCGKIVRKVPTTCLGIKVAPETAYMAAEHWFRNVEPQERRI